MLTAAPQESPHYGYGAALLSFLVWTRLALACSNGAAKTEPETNGAAKTDAPQVSKAKLIAFYGWLLVPKHGGIILNPPWPKGLS